MTVKDYQQQNANNIGRSGSIQPADALRESFSQPTTVSTAGQDGSTIPGATNSVVGSGTNMFKQTQSKGGVLGIQGIQPYDSQSNAQSMNANHMLNNGLGSLGQNNTNDIGISGFGNRFTTQKSNGLGNIVGYNPQGNNYNIIGGVELV